MAELLAGPHTRKGDKLNFSQSLATSNGHRPSSGQCDRIHWEMSFLTKGENMDEDCESARLSYRAATRMGVAGPSASKSLHWSPAEKKERGERR